MKKLVLLMLWILLISNIFAFDFNFFKAEPTATPIPKIKPDIEIGEKYSETQLAKKGYKFGVDTLCLETNDFNLCWTVNPKKHKAYWGKVTSDGKIRIKGRIENEEDNRGTYFDCPCHFGNGSVQREYFLDTVYEK